jgi:hypothetical protein
MHQQIIFSVLADGHACVWYWVFFYLDVGLFDYWFLSSIGFKFPFSLLDISSVLPFLCHILHDFELICVYELTYECYMEPLYCHLNIHFP